MNSAAAVGNVSAKTPRRLRKTVNIDENNPDININSPKTPSRRRTYAHSQKTPNSHLGNQTPRRSTRKVIKPFQDYNDIVRPLTEKKSFCVEIIKETYDSGLEPLEPEIVGTCILDEENKESTPISISIEIKKTNKTDVQTLQADKEETTEKQEETSIGNVSESISVDTINPKKETVEANSVEEATKSNSVETIIENHELTKQEKESQVETCEATNSLSADMIKENQDLGLAPLLPENITLEEELESNSIDIINEKNDLGLAPLLPENITLEEEVETNSIDIINEKNELGLAPLLPERSSVDTIKETDFLGKTSIKDAESKAFEEMESLIFCDDDEDLETSTNANNDTFNASDCIILSPAESQETNPRQVEEIKKVISSENNEKLDIAAVTATPKKLLNLVTEFTPQNSKTLFTMSEIEEEQKRRDSKLPRLPTPYKPKKPDAQMNMEENMDEEELSPAKNIILPVIEIENKNINLQGIRKRSPSTENNIENVNTKRGRGNRVTFYSPANETVVIEEFDVKMKLQQNETNNEKEKIRIPIIPTAPSSPSKKIKVGTKIPTRKVEISKASFKTSTITKASTSALNDTSRPNFKPKTDTKHCVLAKELPKLNKSVPNIKAATSIPTKSLVKINTKTTLNSTTIMKAASTSMLNATSKVDFKPKAELTLKDKIAMRRERHMGMYKGRSDLSVKKSANAKHEIIRGVRSNRRFDLQMQHRQNIEK